MRSKLSAIILSVAFTIGTLLGNPVPLVDVAYAESVPSTAKDAVQLIGNYYRWINQKKYQGAFNIWEKGQDGSAVNGQSFETFESGFKDTASVNAEIGAPSEIEGAAGSNYIQIPVIISATSTDGSQQKFAGAYTMRSSNMADDRSWYIYSAKVKKIK
jgi:hypothetical protein